ncbi:insulin-like growth factor 2 mRNA-binding protein 2 isoform X2 [Liolophura sinensis]|uniref:insulin-like growth factor 2 mRNA-binding protein 2 isoform X2 n=1 Tax=Liolophura sinensis TaxID=3198878 RepID=UPI0031585733
MFKLYVGNLSPGVTEGTLRGLFEEEGVIVSNVVHKKNYAFVECPDQANVDRAIDRLNGHTIDGLAMQVEPPISKRNRKSSKILLRNVTQQAAKEDLEKLASNFGSVQRIDLGGEGVAYITFENADQAQMALTRLQNYDFMGRTLEVEFAQSRPSRRTRPVDHYSGMNNGRSLELPVRMLVRSEFIGAIIGRDGNTIRAITQNSKAKVDIHRRENYGAVETVTTIRGNQPEHCTDAVREILQVVQQEAQALNKGEFPLKLLCPNFLIGRIIGKGGKVINSIMQQTDTHIVVSNSDDFSSSDVQDARYSSNEPHNWYIDRVITVTGPVENSAKAEAMISERMRKFFHENENQQNQMQMFSGFPPLHMMHGIGPGPGPNYPGFRGGPPGYPPYMQQQQQQGGGNWGFPNMFCGPPAPPPQQEMVEASYLYIPENSVGAVIGGKGANVRNIMRLSNAKIKIVSSNDKEGETNGERKGPYRNMSYRKVIITGNSNAQWLAQFYIYDKIKSDGYLASDDHCIKLEIKVPQKVIGRIIGKGGQNLREMMRVSGAKVVLGQSEEENEEEVPVQVIGEFHSIQAAQYRIRQLVSSSVPPPPQQPPYPRRRPGPGPGREQNGN